MFVYTARLNMKNSTMSQQDKVVSTKVSLLVKHTTHTWIHVGRCIVPPYWCITYIVLIQHSK